MVIHAKLLNKRVAICKGAHHHIRYLLQSQDLNQIYAILVTNTCIYYDIQTNSFPK